MSPARMNATGRVKRPMTINKPPTNSITPCVHSKLIMAACGLGDVGNPSNFALPCSRKINPATMREMLSVSGKYLPTRSRFIGTPPSGKINDVAAYSRAKGTARAFCSEVDAGSRQENASKQRTRASVPIQSERKSLWSSPPVLKDRQIDDAAARGIGFRGDSGLGRGSGFGIGRNQRSKARDIDILIALLSLQQRRGACLAPVSGRSDLHRRNYAVLAKQHGAALQRAIRLTLGRHEHDGAGLDLVL